MGIGAISGVSGYNTLYPVYNAMPISGVRPAEDAVTRGNDGTAKAAVDGVKDAENSGKVKKTECQTCKNRKYVDGSNDNGVSFKTPTHIDPNNAAGAVMSHEQEHVSHAIAEGSQANKELLSSTVTLHTAVCPECGRVYVSGGVTHTTMRTTTEIPKQVSNPYQKQKNKLAYIKKVGANLDLAV